MATSSRPLPLISVVVPSYNQACFLNDTFESIFRQNYPRLEVVVMDGGSNDGSVDIIRHYENQLKYWQSQKDGGQSAAINAGMAHCSGDLIAWLNSDDMYWKDALWAVAHAWQEHPEHGLYIGNGFRYDQRADQYIPFIDRHIAFSREALRTGPDYVLQPSTFFLRRAWEAVGGLRNELQFCMDWDVFLRISAEYPVVLINEFLGVSREYEETKTRSGKMKRVFEIARMVEGHTGKEMSAGAMLYAIGTLHDLTTGTALGETRTNLGMAVASACKHFSVAFGGGHWSPENTDPQDKPHVPLARADAPVAPLPDGLPYPSVSVIVPVESNSPLLQRTIDSVLHQRYAKLECMVVSTAEEQSLLKETVDDPTQVVWMTGTKRQLVPFVNTGFQAASGDLVAWLQPGDQLTAGAIRTVARAFAEDPTLDLVYGNAVYIDGDGNLVKADHGNCRTCFNYGMWELSSEPSAPYRWVYTVAQPTVFFRRRMLDEHGALNPRAALICDYDLFQRLATTAHIAKLERTQALVHLSDAEKERWPRVRQQLYRHGRKEWPGRRSPNFLACVNHYVSLFLDSRFRGERGRKVRLISSLLRLALLSRQINPERYWPSRVPLAERAPRLLVPPPRFRNSPVPLSELQPTSADLHLNRPVPSSGISSLVSLCRLPCHPGRTGTEERDYQFIQRLVRLGSVQVFAQSDDTQRDGRQPLAADVVFTRENLPLLRPDLPIPPLARQQLKTRLGWELRRREVPVLGPNCPLPVSEQLGSIETFPKPALTDALIRQQQHFLFVSPITNPIALSLQMHGLPTRMVLLAHQLESPRVERLQSRRTGWRRLAWKLESARTRRYERRNLACYDGVVVASPLEASWLQEHYGYPAKRILVIPQGVDTDYWHPDSVGQAPEEGQPFVVFLGDLQLGCMADALEDLLTNIWPTVHAQHPDMWLRVIHTGVKDIPHKRDDAPQVEWISQVEDARPHLAGALAACLPLDEGSAIEAPLVELLASGIPLVCSTTAAQEMDLHFGQTTHLTGDSATQLADALNHCAADLTLRENLKRNGRRWAEQRTWENQLACLEEWLRDLTSFPFFRGRFETDGDVRIRSRA